MLDANSLIALLVGDPPSLGRRVADCEEESVVISAIAFGEVALGSWNGKRPSMILVDQLRRTLPVVPFDVEAARMYAQLPFNRGSFDRLIAAHALALDVTLVTSNERDFSAIPGLRVENWTR